jgi:hypothetical protein
VTIKESLKLFIPPVVLQTIKAFKNKCNFYSTIHGHIKTSDTILVLGNGPSLKKQLEESLLLLKSVPCICVNHFVQTEYYTQIRPRVYVLADPNFFIPVAIQDTEEKNMKTWRDLTAKTSWNMDVIVSSQYRNNDRLGKLKTNSYINILFINMYDCAIYWSKKKQFELFNANKIFAPSQTVLNTAVYLAIFWRYKNIVLLGADTSWHEEIRVDQKTNELFYESVHFYGTKRKKCYKDAEQTIPVKVHEEFYGTGKAFELYWLLREYAEFNSVKVFNASAKSYIDAFERMSLDDIQKIYCNKNIRIDENEM